MIPILYGSQTGTAAYLSRVISYILEYGYEPSTFFDIEKAYFSTEKLKNSVVMEMNSFNIEKFFDTEIIIFICSTHGDGTEPFNMSRLWRILTNKNLPENIFNHLNYAVFGLGDSSYEKYNYAAKKLFNRLKMLGATPIIEKGLGNTQDKEGYLTAFKPWIFELIEKIKKNTFLNGKNKLKFDESFNKNVLYRGELIEKKMITPENYDKEIMELKFNISDYKDFTPGDCLGILPQNYNYKKFIEFNGLEENNEVVNIISSWADINGVPSQLFFYFLKYELKDKGSIEVLEKIEEIYTNYNFYYEYILLPKRTIFEVLIDLDSKVSLCFIKKFFPSIYYRYFTVVKKNEIFSISVSLIKYFTSIKEPRKGLCSEYFRHMKQEESIDIKIGKSQLFFQAKKLLFICTGVGVQLPRAFLNFMPDKKIQIYYGFRYKDKDFLFSKEYENNKNVELYIASSQEDKVYVQDVFKANYVSDIDEWLIFVSGNCRLNKEVSKMLINIYKKPVIFQSETW